MAKNNLFYCSAGFSSLMFINFHSLFHKKKKTQTGNFFEKNDKFLNEWDEQTLQHAISCGLSLFLFIASDKIYHFPRIIPPPPPGLRKIPGPSQRLSIVGSRGSFVRTDTCSTLGSFTHCTLPTLVQPAGKDVRLVKDTCTRQYRVSSTKHLQSPKR